MGGVGTGERVGDKRFKAQLLNQVLDDILSGKFYYQSQGMYEKILNKFFCFFFLVNRSKFLYYP